MSRKEGAIIAIVVVLGSLLLGLGIGWLFVQTALHKTDDTIEQPIGLK